MKLIFKSGDILEYTKVVTSADIAAFESGKVHDVYSTFSIARDAEWSGRLFVLEMKEEGEEGIGTRITVEHRSPAFIGDEVLYTATFVEITDKGEIVTQYQAHVGKRLIAEGIQGQKILKQEKIDRLFDSIKNVSSD
ncbi:MAG: hypothetical protein JNJ58_00690 [Chitinophagaceae bacterium]|nr:hypothetical protein [Chitinophagaceae bacterium]